MGPPRLRHLLFIALLLAAAIAAFFASSRAAHATALQRQESLHRANVNSLAAAAVQQSSPERRVMMASTAKSTSSESDSLPPPPPRRTITLACAKAGPHWNKHLPKHSTTAIELLPYPFDREAAPSSSASTLASLPPPRSRRRLHPFAQSEVTLLNGSHLARAEATNLRYLLSLRIDDLLYAWRRNAALSQPPGARPLRGWEHPGSELRGHVLGHWLSASALCWATTRDTTLKERMEAALAALGACQQSNGWLSAFPEEFLDRVESLTPVWAPYYTLRKLLQGLLDQHTIAGSAAALRMALRLALCIQKRVQALVTSRGLEHHWQTLNKEFGGLNDVLWKARFASKTK